MKTWYTALMILILSAELYGQRYDSTLVWGSTSGDAAWRMTTDLAGNVYVTGYFPDTLDLDPGSAVELHYATSYNISLQKFRADGILDWAISFGGSNADEPADIAVDDSGNVYLLSHIRGLVDLDPDTGTSLTFSQGDYDIAISKFNPSGQFVWGNRIGGIFNDWPKQIDVDDSGNVYIVGDYSDTVDFDPDTSSAFLISAPGTYKAFVAKYSTNGEYVWAYSFGSYNGSDALTIRIDQDQDVLIGGYFTNTVDFDPGPGVENRTGANDGDTYLLKLDRNGNYIWVLTYGGTFSDELVAIDLFSNNDIAVTGWFQGTMVIPLVGPIVTNGFVDWYVMRVSSTGNPEWVNSYGDNSSWQERATDIIVDSGDGVLTCGYFGGTVDFDPFSGGGNAIADDLDAFILKLDSTGSFEWVDVITGTWGQEAYGMGTNSAGDKVYVSGRFEHPTDFDPTASADVVIPLGFQDAFLWMGNNCAVPTSGSIADTSCAPYISPSGNSYNLTGLYTELLTNVFGCDSLLSISVTILPDPITYLGPDTTVCSGTVLSYTADSSLVSQIWTVGTWTSSAMSILDTVLNSHAIYLTGTGANGCSGTSSVYVTMDSPPIGMFSYTLLGNNVVSFTASATSASPVQYLWNFGDAAPGSTNPNINHTYGGSGPYTVTLIVTNDCGSDTVIQIVNPGGIGYADLLPNNIRITISPNPASENLIVSVEGIMDQNILQMNLFSPEGKLIRHSELECNTSVVQCVVSLVGLSPGTYLLGVSSGENPEQFTRVIVQ